jgi:hypothetical protein
MSELFLDPEHRISHVEQLVIANPEIAGLQAYEYFRSNAAKQKEAFIIGEQPQLNPDYPDLTRDRIRDLAVRTNVVTLMPREKTEKSEALYRAIEYRYSEMFMLGLASDMSNPALTDDERTEARMWFKDINEALYGTPNQQVFNALADKHLVPVLKQQYPVENVNAQKIQSELKELLGQIDSDAAELFTPSEETLYRIGTLVRNRFENIIKHVDPEATYEGESMRTAIAEALEKVGGTDLGWKVEIVPNSSALAVSAHRKVVEVGEDRKAAKGEELRCKILHEVGVHSLRSINAQKAGWLSAAYGQDGYLDFEEALATAFEDAYHGEFNNHGENYYMIAGLAYGLDGHEPREFREVFEIMWRFSALNATVVGQDVTEENMTKWKNNSFNSCLRMFRGTTTTDKGVVYLKDLAYFKGQELAWSVLNGIKTQNDFELLLAGKLDLTRPDHQYIAEQIVAST